MLLSCDCLNVIINSKNGNFSEFDSNISESFTGDHFFKEEIGLLYSCSINIQVPSLVKERETGFWRIVSCVNCNKSCYGICNTVGFGSILARKALEVDTNKINRLKQSDLYSPIFKILIYQSDISSDDETVGEQKTSLYPAATLWLNEQAALTEERVKVFSEKEYAALEELRRRAYKEQKVINRREQECAKDKEVTKVDPIEELSHQFLQKTSVGETKRKRLISKTSIDDLSFDSEGVFLLDGFEGGGGDNSDPEDSDSAGSDDASYHPRRFSAAQLAKSLPIPVPLFMEEKSQSGPLGSPEVPTDIAASIKALAKSVHGDAIFGELPPPRFSTHL